MRKILSAAIIFCISIASFGYALEVGTHKAINAYIAQQAINDFSLDSYLKNQIGIPGGIDEQFNSGTFWTNSQEVWKWIRDGGLYEDMPPWTVPYTRSLNHFHDPLKSWSSAGFKGTFKSSVIWTQDQGWFGSQFGGDWSWKKARNSFYKGLTGSSKTERDTNLADVFRAIGQVMHLVEDASVPAHVRDDGMSFQYRR